MFSWSAFRGQDKTRNGILCTLIWPLGVNRRRRKARESARGFLDRGFRRDRNSHRKENATRGMLWRRLIMLICAGWLPHCIGTSRGCLCLAAGTSRGCPRRIAEGSPHRIRALQNFSVEDRPISSVGYHLAWVTGGAAVCDLYPSFFSDVSFLTLTPPIRVAGNDDGERSGLSRMAPKMTASGMTSFQ